MASAAAAPSIILGQCTNTALSTWLAEHPRLFVMTQLVLRKQRRERSGPSTDRTQIADHNCIQFPKDLSP